MKALEEACGGTDFGHLAKYVLDHDGHTVATRRGTVSPVADVRWCRYQPLPAKAGAELAWALDVMEYDEAKDFGLGPGSKTKTK